MSILSTSPQDNRLFSAEIASKLGDINAAVIVQQLHYWMGKEGVGTIIGGVKYIYNSFNDWVKQFPWLSVWQFRKAMAKLRELGIVKVIRYKSRQWNQTNYYSLDYDLLIEYIEGKSAETIEKSDLCFTANREERNQQIEVRDTALSFIEQRKTSQKETAKSSQIQKTSNESFAATSFFQAEKEEEQVQEGKAYQTELNGLAGLNKSELEAKEQMVEEKKNPRPCNTNVTKNLNNEWKSLVEELDGMGVQINKTVISLVKMYSEEEVSNAIALLKIRKKKKFIPNLAGYFTAALKGNWAIPNLRSEEDTVLEVIDKGSVFRLWYDLAKEIGYCTGQEMRNGEQWVNMGGNWEKWEDTVNRGYSLDYLKKVKKRN